MLGNIQYVYVFLAPGNCNGFCNTSENEANAFARIFIGRFCVAMHWIVIVNCKKVRPKKLEGEIWERDRERERERKRE